MPPRDPDWRTVEDRLVAKADENRRRTKLTVLYFVMLVVAIGAWLTTIWGLKLLD